MDKSKHSFDNHKGIFGGLAMLKNIADEFSFGELETFSNVKVFFLHAAGDTLYLWSVCFKKDADVYELWLEHRLQIKPSFEDKLENLPNFVNFFWNMKCIICESVKKILKLKEEHSAALVEFRSKSNCTKQSLSEIVSPSILKLVEEGDKIGPSPFPYPVPVEFNFYILMLLLFEMKKTAL
ncbi:unnamed protein product [Mucor hiemalis]